MINPSNSNKNQITSVALIAALIVSLAITTIGISAQPAEASQATRDARHDWLSGNDPNFDITRFGTDSSGRPYLDVSGNAGKTVSQSPDIMYAYVFFTNIGGYAIVSHQQQDGSTGWTTYHIMPIDGTGCYLLEPGGSYKIQGKRVTLGGTTASGVDWVATVQMDGKSCETSTFDRAP